MDIEVSVKFSSGECYEGGVSWWEEKLKWGIWFWEIRFF